MKTKSGMVVGWIVSWHSIKSKLIVSWVLSCVTYYELIIFLSTKYIITFPKHALVSCDANDSYLMSSAQLLNWSLGGNIRNY